MWLKTNFVNPKRFGHGKRRSTRKRPRSENRGNFRETHSNEKRCGVYVLRELRNRQGTETNAVLENGKGNQLYLYELFKNIGCA